MNYERLWAPIRLLQSLALLVILSIGCLLALPADAQQTSATGGYTSYAKSSYYLGHGGTPPSLQAFAANPNRYLRSTAAYNSLKQGFETTLRRPLGDAEFRSLLAGDQVRLVACNGRITTSGVNQADQFRWSQRNCYTGEKLIELRVGNQWVVVASQGCFNLVRPITPRAPVCRFVRTDIQRVEGGHVYVNGIHNHNKYCGSDVNLPGVLVTIPGGIQTSSTMVCE